MCVNGECEEEEPECTENSDCELGYLCLNETCTEQEVDIELTAPGNATETIEVVGKESQCSEDPWLLLGSP